MTIKLKVIPQFPSLVTASSPIILNKTNGNYSFSLDAAALAASLYQPSNDLPLMDGAAAAGTSLAFSRANHVHPTDSSRQPLDGELTAIAGLVSAADQLPYFTGSGTASLATFTAFGRSLVDDADASAGRTTLGLTSAATATPAALTKTDDTNVTLTLGGTPTTALLQATSLTLGWTGTLSVARGGTAYAGGAWTTYTATAVAGTGSITSQTSASSYLQIGKLVIVDINVTITNVGTGSGTLTINLPVACLKSTVIFGREIATTGTSLSMTASAGATAAAVFTYHNQTTGLATNQVYCFTGTYEAQ